jgi:glycosyltransferase involved in cell wall biosynthesis
MYEGAERSITVVPNHFLAGRHMLWQSGIVRRSFGAPPMVVEMNPRTISTWCVLLIRRVLGRPTVGWGHVWPRSGRSSRSVPVRRLMWRLTHAVLLYTPAEHDELETMGVNRPAAVAPNAVHSRSRVVPAAGARRHVLQVGRLVPAKKPDLLVRAFAAAADDLPHETELWFVGEGPMRAELETLCAEHALAERVRFFGAVHEPEDLRPIFDECLVACSPGYAGLSVTQALSFGLPCVVADNEPHAPEISLADESNSRAFSADSASSLAGTLVDVFLARGDWIAATDGISHTCLERYSAEAMAEGFSAALALAATNVEASRSRRRSVRR